MAAVSTNVSMTYGSCKTLAWLAREPLSLDELERTDTRGAQTFLSVTHVESRLKAARRVSAQSLCDLANSREFSRTRRVVPRLL
jgi:hypothetical protein